MTEQAGERVTEPGTRSEELVRRIVDAVESWQGVSAEPAERGATALMYEGDQLGHVHHGGQADLGLPEPRRTQELEAGTVRRWFGGWVSKPIETEGEADHAIELFRAVYDHRRAA